MATSDKDRVFSGDVAEGYDRVFVPLIFDGYAADLADRVADGGLTRGSLLEVAAGTGAVTRHLARRLPPEVAITATDLNVAMIEQAQRVGTARPVDWKQADVMALPFDDDTFDVAVCQFGAMFFPDRPAAFAEIGRVLHPRGRFLANVWDRIDTNGIADVVTRALERRFPENPPLFMERTPHGYHDPDTIRADFEAGGFEVAELASLELESRTPTAWEAAAAYCEGSPLRAEIVALVGEDGLAEVTAYAAEAVAERYGAEDVVAPIRAFVIDARSRD